jgi:hypothetical protein
MDRLVMARPLRLGLSGAFRARQEPSTRHFVLTLPNRDGEKINVGFGDFKASSGDQLRNPRLVCAGNDRKFSHRNTRQAYALACWQFLIGALLVSPRTIVAYRDSVNGRDHGARR